MRFYRRLPNHDEQKELVELGDGLVEGLLLVGSGVEARQGRAQPHQKTTFFSKEGILRGRKYAGQHIDRPARIRPAC